MDWPKTPVEYRSSFQPPFCPRRSCPDHLRRDPGYRFHRAGYFSTTRRSRIPRFQCKRCGKGFSRSTFSVSYYLKRPELLLPVAAGLVAGSALRQIARSVNASPNTVAGMSARLGRHALLLHARTLTDLRGRITEPFVFDHFETFEFTQDCPFGIGTAVGSRSWFFYGLDPAPHRRVGARTPAQARRLRHRPKRRMFGRYVGSTRRVLDLLLALYPPETQVHIRCDAHPDYPRAAGRHPQAERISLERHRNVSRRERQAGSRRAVERDRALFPVDLLHKILRHTLAHHRRETIAFSRRLNAAMERMFLTAIWRNFVKRRSERKPRSPTPAMTLGLTEECWTWKRVCSRRLFFDRIELSESWSRLYRRDWTTPMLRSNARHESIRAF